MKADSKFGNLWMMGVGQRFKYPATFTGSPIGPNLDPPDLLDHQAFKHYFIVPKRKQKAQLSTYFCFLEVKPHMNLNEDTMWWTVGPWPYHRKSEQPQHNNEVSWYSCGHTSCLCATSYLD